MPSKNKKVIPPKGPRVPSGHTPVIRGRSSLNVSSLPTVDQIISDANKRAKKNTKQRQQAVEERAQQLILPPKEKSQNFLEQTWEQVKALPEGVGQFAVDMTGDMAKAYVAPITDSYDLYREATDPNYEGKLDRHLDAFRDNGGLTKDGVKASFDLTKKEHPGTGGMAEGVGRTGYNFGKSYGETFNDYRHGRFKEGATDILLNPFSPSLPITLGLAVGGKSAIKHLPGGLEAANDMPYGKAIEEGRIVPEMINDLGTVTMIAGGASGIARGRAFKARGKLGTEAVADEAGMLGPATPKAAETLSKAKKLENTVRTFDEAATPFRSILKNTDLGVKGADLLAKQATNLRLPTVVRNAAQAFTPARRDTRNLLADKTHQELIDKIGVTDPIVKAVGIVGQENFPALYALVEREGGQYAELRARVGRTQDPNIAKEVLDSHKEKILAESNGKMTPDQLELSADAHLYREARLKGDKDAMATIAEANPLAVKVVEAFDELEHGKHGLTQAVQDRLARGQIPEEQLRAEPLGVAKQNLEQRRGQMTFEDVASTPVNTRQGVLTDPELAKAEVDAAPAIVRPYLEAGRQAKETLHQFADDAERNGDFTTAELLRGDSDGIISTLGELQDQGIDLGLVMPDGTLNPEAFGYLSHSPLSQFWNDLADGKTDFAPDLSPQSGKVGLIKQQSSDKFRKGDPTYSRHPVHMLMRRINEVTQVIAREVWDEMTKRDEARRAKDPSSEIAVARIDDPEFENILWRKFDPEVDTPHFESGAVVVGDREYLPLDSPDGLAGYNAQRAAEGKAPLDIVNPRDVKGDRIEKWPANYESVIYKRGEIRLVRRDIRESYSKQFVRQNNKVEQVLRMAFDKPNQAMKFFVLAISPGWHVGNIIGNAIMATFGGGVMPHELGLAMSRQIKEYRKSGASRKEVKQRLRAEGADKAAIRGAKTERTWFTPDNQRLENTGFSEVQRDITRPAGQDSANRQSLDKLTGGRRPIQVIQNRSYEMNNFMDGLFRASTYDAKLHKLSAKRVNTADPAVIDKVVHETLNALGDFQRMTPFERNYIKRIFPFYAWVRHTSQLALRLPFESPARTAWMLSLSQNFGDGDGLVDVGPWSIKPDALVPFAQFGSVLDPDKIASGLSPTLRLPLSDLTNNNLSYGWKKDFYMPPGSEGEAPSWYDQGKQAFLGKQMTFADAVTGKDAIKRYDNGDPRFEPGSSRPMKNEQPHGIIPGVARQFGIYVKNPEVDAKSKAKQDKYAKSVAQQKRDYERKKKRSGQ